MVSVSTECRGESVAESIFHILTNIYTKQRHRFTANTLEGILSFRT